MEPNQKYAQVFMTQAAELCDILFWRYECISETLELSDQIALFFGPHPFPLSEKEKQSFLEQYLDSILLPEAKDHLRSILSGRLSLQEGIYRYKLRINDNVYYHKCKYSWQNKDCILGSIVDDTFSMQGVQQIQDKTSILEYIATHSNMGLYAWQPSTGKNQVTSTWYHNFGLPTGLPFLEAMHNWPKYILPEDYPAVKEATEALRSGEKREMDITFRMNINHHIRWIRYTAAIKMIGSGDDSFQVIGMNQDITSTRQQEERNLKILEALPDFIFIFDRNFFLHDILKSKNITLLHPTEQLLGVDARTIYSPEVSQLYITAIHKCLEEQKLQEIEYPLDVESGRYYFQARMVPFEADKVMALIHDITEKMTKNQELIQARKKAEEADRMKSSFLANMSHEIRTPLNAIVGFSEILATTDDTTEKETYREIIQTNSNLLLQLINDILDLSRIESGKTDIILQATELNALIQEVGQVHLLKMPPKVQLFVEHPQEKTWLQTDPNRVTQVLFNFMSNATKNTTQGQITLRLSKENHEVHFSVSDTGCGIRQDMLETIFERFIKINDFVQGTGLGLSICRSIADKLQGRIDVESEFGKGSTFSLYLPIKEI